MNNPIIGLAIAIFAGMLLTRLVKLVHLPNVTGYLIAGLLIGPSCLGLVTHHTLGAVEFFINPALGFIAFFTGGAFKHMYLQAIFPLYTSNTAAALTL